MLPNQSQPNAETSLKVLFYVGLGLIICGAVSMVGLAYSAYLVLTDPESLPIAKLFLASLSEGKPLLTIQAEERDFIIVAADTLEYMFFAALGLMLIAAGVAVANGLIAGGIKLVAVSKPGDAE
jgi:hypothetical protein